MECQEITKNLFGIVENTLPQSVRDEIENHLHSCQDCRAILSEFRQTIGLIEKEASVEPNPFTGTRILQHVESALFSEYHRRQRSLYRVLQPALLAFSLLLAVLIGFAIGKRGMNDFQANSARQEIESIRSDLFISDLTNDDNILFLNP